MIKTLQTELTTRDEWIQKYILAGDALPFSFTYGKRAAKKLLPAWKRAFSQSADSEGVTRYETRWTDPETGLEVTCKAASFPDYPTIEWTLFIKNNGTENTPILEDIQGMDISVPRNAEDACYIRTIRGDICSALSYEPITYNFNELKILKIAPLIGKPCVGAFPYFNVQTAADRGVIIVIGWPGQWAASFESPYWFPPAGPTNMYVSAGQELTCLSLRPGEQIRTQLSLLMFWEGDYRRSQNVWRRFINEHNTPEPGKRFAPSLMYGDDLVPDEEKDLRSLREYVDNGLNVDIWKLDAGWFPMPKNEWWDGCGTWEADKSRFPNGIKPEADAAHANGMKFCMWFEPERVHKDTWIHKNHPEWLYQAENKDPFLEGSYLLNLGCPEALDWMIERIDSLITEIGVDIYRQDFCFPPLHYWRASDAADRRGMAENLHVQGYLKLWDELLRRHPDLMIDSCSGGGGRQELETLRRTTLVISKTDDFDEARHAEYLQTMTYGLSQWYTRFSGGGPVDNRYAFLSGMAADRNFYFINRPIDGALGRESIRMFREAAENFYGDYYPLTEFSCEKDAWMAYQFNRPEAGEGIVQAFRRIESAVPAMSFKLHDLDADAEYEVSDVQAQRSLGVMRGAALMDAGLRVELPSPRSAALIKYKKM